MKVGNKGGQICIRDLLLRQLPLKVAREPELGEFSEQRGWLGHWHELFFFLLEHFYGGLILESTCIDLVLFLLNRRHLFW